jgi:hypothetical protein
LPLRNILRVSGNSPVIPGRAPSARTRNPEVK